MKKALNATVSGSFRRGMPQVRDAVFELTDLGINVLSPADPRIVDQYGEFVFVASDRLRSINLVQRRHLAAIQASDFLWLVDPEGYVGISSSLEIGYATCAGTPVFASEVPTDLTLRHFVRVVSKISEVVPLLVSETPEILGHHVLLDPSSAVSRGHTLLDELEERFLLRPDLASDDEVTQSALAVQQLFELN